MPNFNQRTAALRCGARAIVSRSVSRYDELPRICRAIGAYDIAKFFDAVVHVAATDYAQYEIVNWSHWDAFSVPYPAFGQQMAYRLYFDGIFDIEFSLGVMEEMAKAFGAFDLGDFSKRFLPAIRERRGGEGEDYARLQHVLIP